MSKSLVIVFAKNQVEGTVKTRLAESIGNVAALEVYKELLKVTEEATSQLPVDTWIFYSNEIDQNQWPQAKKYVQQGDNLGLRMKNAFSDAFGAGYQKVVLIGSDLPGMSSKIILQAFDALNTHEAVFGPAEDGGYYLIGLHGFIESPFINKPWSQPHLLKETLNQLDHLKHSYTRLPILNDIDTIDDLLATGFLKQRESLRKTIALLND